MCPFCIATAAIIAGGATGTSGLAALVVSKFRQSNYVTKFPTQAKPKEDHDEHQYDGATASEDRFAQ
jgi:hypothetical protein